MQLDNWLAIGRFDAGERSNAMQIIQAKAAEDFAAFGDLVTHYVNWCRNRLAERPGLVDGIFSIQSLDNEVRELPTKYSPPEGRVFLARSADGVSGCCAFRRLDPKVCEMKRLFVLGSAHGQGLGRKLCVAAIAQARTDGFEHMHLDTLRLFTESIALYRTLGFREREPYLDYPQGILAEVLFMELQL